MDQLISQKVDVIIAYPITDAALTQGIAAAKAAGIPVVTNQCSFQFAENPATRTWQRWSEWLSTNMTT